MSSVDGFAHVRSKRRPVYLSNAGLDYDDYSAKRIRFGEADGGVEELQLFQA